MGGWGHAVTGLVRAVDDGTLKLMITALFRSLVLDVVEQGD